MEDSVFTLSYISRTSPSILTSVHNAMDKIYKSLIAHGYETCDWDANRINCEVENLLDFTLYDEEFCRYAILMETSMIAIAINISDAIIEYAQEHEHADVIGFETYNTFIQYFEKAVKRNPKHRNLADAYCCMNGDLIFHDFEPHEIFQMMQAIVQEHSVVCNQYERFFKIKSEKASDRPTHPTITMDPDKKTNRIGIHLAKNNTDSKPNKIELLDMNDCDEDSDKNNSGVGKFPDWLREEFQKIEDFNALKGLSFQNSSDEDDDDEELTQEELEKLTPEELIDRLMKIITTKDEDDEEDDKEHYGDERLRLSYVCRELKALAQYFDIPVITAMQINRDELTQEELIDHAMVCLMDQIDEYKNAILPMYLYLSLRRKMRSRYIFDYPDLASILFGFPF